MNERSDFREYLNDVWKQRQRKNPRFSLRSFARFLEIDNSRLSKILKGSRPLPSELIDHLGQRLGLSLKEIERFKKAGGSQASYSQITQDQFDVISSPIHYAVLEAMKLQGFTPSAEWVAAKLGERLSSVRSAISRLIRSSLLIIDSAGKWTDPSKGFSTHILGSAHNSFAHRKHQEAVLDGALRALREIPKTERVQTSMMMATSRSKLEEARKRIIQFQRELCAFLEEGPEEKDSIFQLSTSFFPLTFAARESKRRLNQ